MFKVPWLIVYIWNLWFWFPIISYVWIWCENLVNWGIGWYKFHKQRVIFPFTCLSLVEGFPFIYLNKMTYTDTDIISFWRDLYNLVFTVKQCYKVSTCCSSLHTLPTPHLCEVVFYTNSQSLFFSHRLIRYQNLANLKKCTSESWNTPQLMSRCSSSHYISSSLIVWGFNNIIIFTTLQDLWYFQTEISFDLPTQMIQSLWYLTDLT